MKMFHKISKSGLFCFLFFALAIGSIYFQVRSHEFVSYDDLSYITNNSFIQHGITVESIKWSFSSDNKVDSFHPLTWVFHIVNYTLFDADSGLHLLMNVLWHFSNTCLLFFILQRMTHMFWPNVIAASLFAVHPLNVESVAWASELKNLLSTFFWLLTIAAYYYYVKGPSLLKYLLMIVIFGLGIFTKPMLITLPFVLLLLDYWPLERFTSQRVNANKFHFFPRMSCRRVRPLILEKIPLICIIILEWYMVSHFLNKTDNFVSFSRKPLSLRFENLFVSFAAYLGKFIWPSDLVVYYPFPKSLPNIEVVLSAILLLSITFIFLVPLRGKKYLTTGWFWFLGTLIPVSGLIQAGDWPAMADRYAYVPFIGLFIIFAWGIYELSARLNYGRDLVIAISLLIIIGFGFTSWRQVHYWENSESLYSHALAVSSSNYVAHNNLGGVLVSKGEIDEAIKHFQQALEIEPLYYMARANLIKIFMEQNKKEEAEKIYSEGIQLQGNSFRKMAGDSSYPIFKDDKENSMVILEQKTASDPEDSNAHLEMAKRLDELGHFEEALHSYLKFLAINPNHFDSLNRVAMIYNGLGNYESAINYFNKALVLNPDSAEINYNLAISLAAANRPDEAEKYFTKAIELYPSFVDAYNNLGILFAQQARLEEALKCFEKALSIDSSSVAGHTNMGILLYQIGKEKEAIFHFKEAVKLKPQDKKLRKYLRMATST